MHISLNFAPNEDVNDDTFNQIIDSYLLDMGYSNCPFIAIRHTDNHPHVHLLLSTVDINGNWINNSKNYDRSFKVSRTIEKNFNLNPLPHTNASRFLLSEKNASLYSFRNAFIRASKSPNYKNTLYDLMGKSFFNKFLYHKNISNKEAINILGEELFHRVSNFLLEKKFLNKSFKEQIILDISSEISKSSSFDNFLDNLKKKGIYVRILNHSGSPYIVFGYQDVNFFVKENQLPFELTFDRLASRLGSPTSHSYDRNYFKSTTQEDYYIALSYSYSIKEFISNLKKLGYSCEIDKDNSGKFLKISIPDIDYSFTDRELSKSFTIKKLLAHEVRQSFYECLKSSKSFANLSILLRQKGLDLKVSSDYKVSVRDLNNGVSIPLSMISPYLSYQSLNTSFYKNKSLEFKYPQYPLRYSSFNPAKHKLNPFYIPDSEKKKEFDKRLNEKGFNI